MAPFTIPKGFLAGPAENITVDNIDFTKTKLPECKGLYACVLDNVLSPAECTELLKLAEASTNAPAGSKVNDIWERAMVNIGGGEQMLLTDTRNCGRVIWDSREVVDLVFRRVAHIPEVQKILRLEAVPKVFGNGPSRRGEVWKFSRCNERMRFLRYEGGEYFRPHCDGSYETPDGKERSYFTLHLYLNDHEAHAELPPDMSRKERLAAVKNGLKGGATTFHSMNMRDRFDVLPKAGRVLLFQHRDLLHSGDDVVQGVKYTMRTDLLYSLEEGSGKAGERSKMAILEEPISKATWTDYLS